jgi:uncharacterized protein (DUF1778 family)
LIKEERLNIRLSARQKTVLAQAAQVRHTTVSDFVLETAVQAAEQLIAEQSHFRLPEADWKAFCEILDAPPKPIAALRKLLNEPSVFDQDVP